MATTSLFPAEPGEKHFLQLGLVACSDESSLAVRKHAFPWFLELSVHIAVASWQSLRAAEKLAHGSFSPASWRPPLPQNGGAAGAGARFAELQEQQENAADDLEQLDGGLPGQDR